MAMQPFQAESKKLMDLMINSIDTNTEIFLRELISKASDAIDKLYFKSLTDTSVGMDREDFRILLTLDKDARMLTVSDNGIGMTREELEQNLGTIAHSGSQDFKGRGLLLRLHGSRPGHRHLEGLRQRPGLAVGVQRGGRL